MGAKVPTLIRWQIWDHPDVILLSLGFFPTFFFSRLFYFYEHMGIESVYESSQIWLALYCFIGSY